MGTLSSARNLGGRETLREPASRAVGYQEPPAQLSLRRLREETDAAKGGDLTRQAASAFRSH